MPTKKPTTIGERIRAARLAADLSQVDVAAHTGLAQDYLSRLETGKIVDPASSTIRRVCEAIGCDSNGILGLRR